MMMKAADRSPARTECYAAIIEAATSGLDAYYRKFPDRIGDKRSDDALKHSMAGIHRILRMLDRYEINFADEKKPGE